MSSKECRFEVEARCSLRCSEPRTRIRDVVFSMSNATEFSETPQCQGAHLMSGIHFREASMLIEKSLLFISTGPLQLVNGGTLRRSGFRSWLMTENSFEGRSSSNWDVRSLFQLGARCCSSSASSRATCSPSTWTSLAKGKTVNYP